MRSRDETVSFYDSEDSQRHGFGDLAPDRARLEALLAREAGAGDLVLEVGCGTGRLADLHPGWFGIDLGHPSLARHVPGRSAQADARAIPLASGSAAVVLSVHALEHVPEPAAALAEIDRVLRPGGVAYLNPAWFCSPWPMNPLSRAPLGSLPPARRLLKLAGAARYSRPARLPAVLLRKLRTELALGRARGPLGLEFGRLEPDLTAYSVPDADASASLEPAATAAWFVSRGYVALTYATRLARLTGIRSPVVVRKPGRTAAPAATPAAQALRCPACRGPFEERSAERLACASGHRFPVEGGVPRLVA